MQSQDFDEKRELFDSKANSSGEEIQRSGAHERGSLEEGAQANTMASGSARYLRYILFAVFVCCLMISNLVLQVLIETGSFDTIFHLIIVFASTQYTFDARTRNEVVRRWETGG
jgi:hypothetical protein